MKGSTALYSLLLAVLVLQIVIFLYLAKYAPQHEQVIPPTLSQPTNQLARLSDCREGAFRLRPIPSTLGLPHPSPPPHSLAILVTHLPNH